MTAAKRKAYAIRIQGIVNATGQIYHWWHRPDYATGADQIALGLREPPTLSSAKWDIHKDECSVARWQFLLAVDQMTFNPWATKKAALTQLTQGVSATATRWNHRRTNTQAGIDTNSILLIGRETVQPSAATGSNTYFDTDPIGTYRGLGGSDVTSHDAPASVFDVPPALTGRYVELVEVTQIGASANDEVVIARGYIANERASDLLTPRWDVTSRFTADAEIGRVAVPERWIVYRDDDGRILSIQPNTRIDTSNNYLPTPRFRSADDGGYWYLPALGLVIPAAYSTNWSLQWDKVIWEATDGPIAGGGGISGDAEGVDAYEVLVADPNLDYPVLGYTPDGGGVHRQRPAGRHRAESVVEH